MYGNIWFCEIEKNRITLFQMLLSCYIFNRNIRTCPHMLNYFVYYRTNTYIWIYRVLFSISRFDYCQEDFTQVFLRCSGVFWLSQHYSRDHKFLYYQEISHLSKFGRNEVRVCWYISVKNQWKSHQTRWFPQESMAPLCVGIRSLSWTCHKLMTEVNGVLCVNNEPGYQLSTSEKTIYR